MGDAIAATTGRSFAASPAATCCEHVAMDRGVTDDPTLPDTGAAGLELRFDEEDEVGVGHRAASQRRGDREEGDEGEVGDGERYRTVHVIRVEVPHVHPVHRAHPRVRTQRPRELAATDVDREHLRGTALEQAVGEAARRGARVESPAAGDGDGEGVERGGELLAAA